VVESQPSKLLVAGSIPVSRSMILNNSAELRYPGAVENLKRRVGQAYFCQFRPDAAPEHVRV
jgi:hypothetical protein